MPRLTQEQKLRNNPLRRVVTAAGVLMPVRSPLTLRRFEAAEPGQLGRMDPGALSLMGHAVIAKSPYAATTVPNLLLAWAVPDKRPGRPGSIPGEVSRIDISRTRLTGTGGSVHTLTRVSLFSAPLTVDGVRLGVGVNVENRGDRIVDAGAEFAIAGDDRYAKPLGSAVFDALVLSPLDSGRREHVTNRELSARLPALEEMGRLLTEAAANPSAHTGVRLYIR